MAKPNGTTVENGTKSDGAAEPLEPDANAKWGTWEELLLACAVNRYGTNSWDSVASEIQKRSSCTPLSLLTPDNCQNKYLDLTRRFFLKNDPCNNHNNSRNDDVRAADDDGSIISTDESVPLLEELRKLRVAELRRELQRYDLSIVSLQSKVKRLKEERERSSRESENGEEKSSDLRKTEEAGTLPERDADADRREVVKDEPAAGKDEQSVNEPVSTDRRSEEIGTVRNNGEEGREPGRTGEGNEEPVRTGEDKPVKEEDSCYGSSDSVEKEEPEPEPDPVRDEVKVEPESVSDSPELVESVAESKDSGEEEATNKECSDVQSSATKSRRDGENENVLRGSSNDDDLENKNRSPAVKLEASVESQPLIDFLDNGKVHKLGSLFLRRLDSQEAPDYKSLIRQHVDLETVQRRVKEGIYSDSNLRFFRDLLLLVNNAMVFFRKNTPEFLAAMELRHLVTSEMAQRNAKSDASSEKQAPLQKVSLPKKENSEPSESLLRKPKLGGPLIVCRKRSSIAAKASASSSASDGKRDQATMPTEESAGPDAKQMPPQPPAKTEEPRITKKRSKDRFASVNTNLKKNAKNGSSDANSKQMSGTILEKNKGKGLSSSQQPQPRCESKNSQSSVDLKKRSAANFLNRMKQSSSSNSGTLLDALKCSPLTAANNSRGGSELKKNENGKGSGGSDHKKNEKGKGNGGSEHKKREHGKGVGGSEHKKNENVKGSGKKEQVSTRSSDAKQAKEKRSPAKRALGRPPKKGAPPPTPSGKRGRDGRESESVASKHQRKRSRK